jgi:HSP20 family molecular chaperone IbpA
MFGVLTCFLKEKYMTTITTYRPGLVGRNVLDSVFDNFFIDFPHHLKQSTQGYPVADIFRDNDGSTVMEFALAGFSRDDLTIDVKPDARSIMVSAKSVLGADNASSRRIAKRSFKKTFVNYDNNLDLINVKAVFDNGLLTITVPQRPDTKPITIKIQ